MARWKRFKPPEMKNVSDSKRVKYEIEVKWDKAVWRFPHPGELMHGRCVRVFKEPRVLLFQVEGWAEDSQVARLEERLLARAEERVRLNDWLEGKRYLMQ